MQLRYTDSTEKEVHFTLTDGTIILGRDEQAGLTVHDAQASRNHCEVRLWDGDYVVKDLKSRNGTYVNEEQIAIAQLRDGDQIRIGETTIAFEETAPIGTSTAIREVAGEMDEGKGYRTILREIIHDAGETPAPEDK